jgi:hypothetical protein
LRTSEAFRQFNLNLSIPMYFTVGLMYMAVNYALSKLAQYLQRRLGNRRGRGQAAVAMVLPEADLSDQSGPGGARTAL